MKNSNIFTSLFIFIVVFFSNNAISSRDYFSIVTFELNEITLENGGKASVSDAYPVLSNYKEHQAIVSATFNVYDLAITDRRQMQDLNITKKDNLTNLSHIKWAVVLQQDDSIDKKKQDYISKIIHSINVEDQGRKSSFKKIDYNGWDITIDKDLDDDYMLKTKALSSIKMQLYKISYKLNEQALKKIKTVPIVLHKNKPYENEITIAYYDSKYRAVIFHNADKLIEQGNVKNAVVLHELAHGFHDINIGFEYQPIIDAYNNALQTGLYQNVRSTYDDGLTDKAYALTNHYEYFAELTESYFASPAEKFGNDYFPFNRFELKKYDRIGYDLLKEIWGL